MKRTQGTIVFLFAALTIYLGPRESAQAYYNPQTGRWLSRDPISDQGFRRIELQSSERIHTSEAKGTAATSDHYAFLQNTVPNAYDYLGLLSCCKCGDDVTRLINQTLLDIAATYAQAGWWKRHNACAKMFNFLTRPAATADSWDIKWLQGYRKQRQESKNCNECADTVTFNGMCVRKNELNYVMYGWGMVLCGKDQQALADWYLFALLRRLWSQEPLDSIARKHEFAQYGWARNGLPDWVAWPQCKLNKKLGTADVKDWKWQGLKP